MTDTNTTIRQLSEKLAIQPASLKRKISRKGLGSFNLDEVLPVGITSYLTDDISDDAVITIKAPDPHVQLFDAVVKEVKESPAKRIKTAKKKTLPSLQERLSADWLIISVLVVILFADMTAFAIIGQHEFSGKITGSAFIFAVIGLATGVGSVVTFNRIEEKQTAEAWKWIFGILQFFVFSLAINEVWFYAELIMTSMFVLVFIGVQRSIKK